VGVKDPGVHSGQVEQPNPEPVIRTEAPVTTIADCVKTINDERRLKALALFSMGRAYGPSRLWLALSIGRGR